VRKRTYSEALKQEVRAWACKPLAEIEKLDIDHPTVYERLVDGVTYHVEVELVHPPEDYFHVCIGICSERSIGFASEAHGILFWRDGRVDCGDMEIE
jgi:hypothetical protein